MKKTWLTLLFVLVLIIAAPLTIPKFIDWNQYREKFEALISSNIGRTAEIKGNIELSILPSLSVKLANVKVANVEGASDSDLATIEGIELKVELAPLLRSDIIIKNLLLVRPTLNVEILAG
ncbi:MAG: AsmA family protein, partial [Pseudomonadota bacterium]|nr:AsmA family protein [Pseudomonadota bacterium]